jgi:hypothetical protein
MLRNLDVTESQALPHLLPETTTETDREPRAILRSHQETLPAPAVPLTRQPKASRPGLSARLRAHYREHPAGYRRAGDCLMFLGLLLVVVLSAYVLIWSD